MHPFGKKKIEILDQNRRAKDSITQRVAPPLIRMALPSYFVVSKDMGWTTGG